MNAPGGKEDGSKERESGRDGEKRPETGRFCMEHMLYLDDGVFPARKGAMNIRIRRVVIKPASTLC